MSVWPETGTPARWSPPEPRAASGSPSGDRAARPSTAIPSGVRGRGSTQRPSGRGCEWRADDHAFGRRKSAASRLSTGTRVTAEGWRNELEPPAHPFGVVRWIATRSLRGSRRGCVGTERLRVPRADGVDLPFGVEPSASHGPFGARRDAAEALPSGFAGATRDRFLSRLFGDAKGRDRKPRQPSGCRRAGTNGRLPSGTATDHRAHGARQSRNTLPSLRLFGSGDATRVRSRGETSSWSGRRPTARQHRNVSTQKPMGASSGAQRKRCVVATDSSVEQSLEVGSASSAPWQHGSERAANDERERQPVNAADSARRTRGDGRSKAAGEGNASKGIRHWGWFHRTFGSTAFGSRKAERLTGELETW